MRVSAVCFLALVGAACGEDDATAMMQSRIVKNDAAGGLDIGKLMENLPKGMDLKNLDLKGMDLKGLDLKALTGGLDLKGLDLKGMDLSKLMPALSQLPAGMDMGSVDPSVLMKLLPMIPDMLSQGKPYLLKVELLVKARLESIKKAGLETTEQTASLVDLTAKNVTEAIAAFTLAVNTELGVAKSTMDELETAVDAASDELLVPIINKIIASVPGVPKNLSTTLIAPILRSVLIGGGQKDMIKNTTDILDRLTAAPSAKEAAEIVNVELDDFLAEQLLKSSETTQNNMGLLEALFGMIMEAGEAGDKAKDVMSTILIEVANTTEVLITNTEDIIQKWNFAAPEEEKSQATAAHVGFGLLVAATMASMF